MSEQSDQEFLQIQARRIKALAHAEVNPLQPGTPERVALKQAVTQGHPKFKSEHERNLIGLALSGGGIRSATFGLGVLQGLADLGLLKFCDYLSTVSGGGYIGSWLAAWIKREGDLDNVVKQLRPKRTDQSDAVRGFQNPIPVGQVRKDEPEPIAHLREFSNYLSPRLSLTSADGWSLIAIYLRNLLANQLALLPTVLALLLLVRGLTAMFAWQVTDDFWGNVVGVVALVFLLLCFVFQTLSLRLVSDRTVSQTTAPRAGPVWFYWTVALVSVASVLLTWILFPNTTRAGALWPATDHVTWSTRLSGWQTLTGWTLGELPAGLKLELPETKPWTFQVRELLWMVGIFAALQGGFSLFLWSRWRTLMGFLSGAVGGALIYLGLSYVLWPHAGNPAVVTTCGPPLFLLIFMAANFTEVALLGRVASEQEREWRSRFNAWVLIVVSCWMVLFGLTLYGSLWLQQLDASIRVGLTTGWLLTALGGLLAGKSSKTDTTQGKSWLDYLVGVAPIVFLVGLICAMSSLAAFLVIDVDVDSPRKAIEQAVDRRNVALPAELDVEVTYRSTFDVMDWKERHEIIDQQQFVSKPRLPIIRAAQYWYDVRNPDWRWLWGSLVVGVVVAAVASGRVDVNEFSLNALYANRLARCYLGASRRKVDADFTGTPGHSHGPVWNPNRVTGFDPDDDFELTKLRIGGPASQPGDQASPDKEQNYWGPYPLINTALNLIAGERLAWQERRAESFLLSPSFCGAQSLGYRETDKYAAGYASEHPLTLGRCVAISGAAANPNMGYHSSPAVTALMTIFNVRLGSWLPNPRPEVNEHVHERVWQSRGPGFLLKWLAIELWSLTNASRRYLNLSDGGHFENLGVYELVRRKCRLIIVSDAGADPKFEFEDLAGLIRKCRTDFGIDIELDVRQLRPPAGSRQSQWHCAIGTIRYDQIDPTAPVGTLIYLKPSLTGDEPTDVQHYSGQHADFPHQPTLDQFFSESQFESYRALGYHCVNDILGDVAKRLEAANLTDPKPNRGWATPSEMDRLLTQVSDHHAELAENLVDHVRTQWLARPPDMDENFFKSTEGFVQFQQDLRDKPELNAISRDIYRDLNWATVGQGANHQVIRPAELHSASLMLQVMENAWLGMHLDQHHSHKLNAGWMNLFQRWTHSTTLRRYWPLLRHEYSRDFAFFCEREFALQTEVGSLEPITELNETLWDRLREEFRREWPIENGRHRGLDGFGNDVWQFSQTDGAGNTRVLKAGWYARVSLKSGLLADDDPLKEGFVAGVIGVRPLANKLKLTAEELKQLNLSDDQFWNLTDVGLQTFAAKGTAPSQATLDGRRGYELVLWVRPGYRHQKVGQELLQKFLNEMLDDEATEALNVGATPLRQSLGLGGPFKLVVYFPKSGWHRSADKFAGVKKMWLTFFSFYGFRRPGSSWPNILDDEVLVLKS